MKSVMISIKPKWCEMIVRGQKTIEVRKSRPKLEAPFKCYIYCTKPRCEHEDFIRVDCQKIQFYGGQKIIGEFVCDEILQFNRDDYNSPAYDISDDDLNRTCLFQEDLYKYAGGKTLYGWHISGLVIYDKPKELSEFVKPCNRNCFAPCPYYQGKEYECEGSIITRPPQSWCYVEEVRK